MDCRNIPFKPPKRRSDDCCIKSSQMRIVVADVHASRRRIGRFDEHDFCVEPDSSLLCGSSRDLREDLLVVLRNEIVVCAIIQSLRQHRLGSTNLLKCNLRERNISKTASARVHPRRRPTSLTFEARHPLLLLTSPCRVGLSRTGLRRSHTNFSCCQFARSRICCTLEPLPEFSRQFARHGLHCCCPEGYHWCLQSMFWGSMSALLFLSSEPVRV